MIGKIIEIKNGQAIISLAIDISEQPNLVNLHVAFDDKSDKLIIGEISSVDKTKMVVNIVGEISDGVFMPGTTIKPSFKSNVRLIELKELELILGSQTTKFGQTCFGRSNIYQGYKINVNVNDFFNSHFAVLGNSGSGKSCGVASIIQKLYTSSNNVPLNSNLFFFDAYGEYSNAFSKLSEINPNLGYKTLTTNVLEKNTNNLLQIPIWLLDVDDLALLLSANSPSQIPIIEKALNLVKILSGDNEAVIKKKNDIIARALEDILLSGGDSTKVRDQVVGVLAKFNTSTLSLNSQIVQPGYTRTLKQCLYIDKTGKMQEMELVVDFIRSFIVDDIEVDESALNPYYSLYDLEQAMEFALVSEGILKSNKIFDNANVLSVRLHSLVTSDYCNYFNFSGYVNKEEYIKWLMYDETGKKCQIVNFNINYVDDRIAKVMVKIISKMIFTFSNTLRNRGSIPFHIIIEEAHRYVQHDNDVELIGYNIFERIAKEGRKYGIFLGLITQRPSELSDTCISQCLNFIVLRTIHPLDLDCIMNMVPSVTDELCLQLKNLKPGNCIAFGSAFSIPTSMYIELPNPRPSSNNVDLEKIWFVQNQTQTNPAIQNVNVNTVNNNINT